MAGSRVERERGDAFQGDETIRIYRPAWRIGVGLVVAIGGRQTISGQLKCHVEGGMSFIVGSSRQVDCVFTPAGGLPPEAYTGSINKIGIDLGMLSSESGHA